MDKRLFSDWLSITMREKGFSQSQLAAKSGLSRQAISNFVNQVSLPNPDSCRALAKGLGIPDSMVLEKAGHLRPKPTTTEPTIEEASYKLSKLPDWQQRIVLRFIDSLLTEGNDANSTIPMAPSNNK